jgi:histidinol-phosphate aminotransferase
MTFNKVLDNLTNYEAGKPIELVVREYGIKTQDVIKLASNENPFGCSSKVIDVVSNTIKYMNRYPDDSFYELKESLADFYNLTSKNIVIGSGSDQVIEFICKAKLNINSKVLVNGITFAMYEIYAKQQEATIIKIDSTIHNIDKFIEFYNKYNPDVVFLCTPCNPVGDAINRDDVIRFLDIVDKDTIVVIDGAYMEYAKSKDKNKEINPKDLIDRYENVIYLGTFSKVYGLGGMRVGYGISNIDMISNLHKVRPPFNITTLSLKASIEAIKDQEFVDNTVRNSFDEMKRYEEFAKSNNIEYIPSYTNFITFKLEKCSSSIAEKLMTQGIIIRNLRSYNLNAIRITIGTKEQNDKFFEKFSEILKG